MVVRAAAVVVALAGCAGSGGELRGWTWRDRATTFRVGELPSSWRRVKNGAAVQFFHPQTGAVILADDDCRKSADAPLPVLTNTLLIGFTEREIVSQEQTSLAGREALRSSVRARLDGVPVAIDAVAVKKDGCSYDLVYIAPRARAADDRPAFDHFVAGFDTVGID